MNHEKPEIAEELTRRTPEGETGPYFADDCASGFNRSSIV